MTDKKSTLLNNTIMLYILTFSNYIFGFMTIPYQTRVLGPEYYGKIGFAMAFTAYFRIFLDFGFILSATSEVSKNRDDKKKLSMILSSVVASKIILITLSFVAFITIVLFIPRLRDDFLLYFLFFIYVSLNSLQPDYLYRGIETMKIITYRTIIVKLFFTIMIFVFLKDKSQYYYIPLLNIIGIIGALIAVYSHVVRVLGLRLIRIEVNDILSTLKDSSVYFYSRIATTVYDATNTLILGLLYPTGNILGYYTSSNKLVGTARGAFSPIADSLYPYMIKNKNYNLIKKILKFLMPVIITGSVLVVIYAEFVTVLVFGEEFRDSALILRLLMPMVVLGLPNYLLGFPTLAPLGLAKYANFSTIFGAVVQVFGLLFLFLFGTLNIVSICILTSFTELCVLIFRILVIKLNKK